MNKIPFSKNTFDEKEEKAIKDVMKSGWLVLGPKTAEFEEAFAKYVGSKYAVFVDSGTSAFSLALRVANYNEGFVRIPSLTFCSDAEVLWHQGFDIKFVDVDKETLCVDEQYDELMPTNFAGVKAKGKGNVIDSCHRIEKNDVKDSKSLHFFSFYATKNLNTVQGGMIALNSKKKYEWLIMARDHGVDKGTKQRYEGRNPLYDVKFPGWRVKPDDLRAVIGIEQLKKLPWITERRNEIVARYNKNLGQSRIGNHLYPIFVNKRKKFIEEMYKKGVQVSIHFRPINTLTAYKQKVDLPVTDWIGPRICSLPLFPAMTNKEVDFVSKCVLDTKLII